MSRRVCGVLLALLTLLVASCAGVPSSSSPQAIGTVQRPAPPGVPAPTPGMEPDVLLREFLKATADPSNRHLAARQFLTESGSRAWDDAGSAVLIENAVFMEQRTADRVVVNMRASTLGTLSDSGVFETAAGDIPDPGQIVLVKTNGQWRIDSLPNGVFLDWAQFQATYRRYTLYFADPTGRTVVPDPRYVAVADPDLLATELVTKLINGPRTELTGAVRNQLGGNLRLRGPVTRADGGKVDVGRGYGGVRVELEGDLTPDPRSRQLLAAQVIWTLSRAGIAGPYVLQANSSPLDERLAQGWNTSDVAATDPGVSESAGIGLYGLLNGSLVGVDHDTADPVRGSFGQVGDQVSASLSRSGREVASVVRVPGDDPLMSLWVGANGGDGSEAAQGRTLTRPTWTLDDTVWVVIDGGNVVRVIQESTTSMVARAPVDSTAVAQKYPGQITELALSRDGTRAAMIIDGQVVLASVIQTDNGEYALTHPRRVGYGLGNSAVSLSWRTGDDIAVARNDATHPVANVNLDGVNSDLDDRNLLVPVSTIVATPSIIYLADQRGVLQLTGLGTPEEQWVEVRPLMVPQTVPVLPG